MRQSTDFLFAYTSLLSLQTHPLPWVVRGERVLNSAYQSMIIYYTVPDVPSEGGHHPTCEHAASIRLNMMGIQFKIISMDLVIRNCKGATSHEIYRSFVITRELVARKISNNSSQQKYFKQKILCHSLAIDSERMQTGRWREEWRCFVLKGRTN